MVERRVILLASLATLALGVVACAGSTRGAAQGIPTDLASVSAGLIGCAPDAVRIEDLNRRQADGAPTDWIATCGGSSFYCCAQGAPSCTAVPGP